MPSLPPLAVRAVRWVAPVGGLFVAALSLDLLEARADEDDEAAAAAANTLVVGAGWSGPPDLDAVTRRGRFVVIVERGAPGASRPLRLELEVEVERAAHLPQLAAYAAHVHDAVAVAAAAIDVNDELWDPLESTCRHASLSIL